MTQFKFKIELNPLQEEITQEDIDAALKALSKFTPAIGRNPSKNTITLTLTAENITLEEVVEKPLFRHYSLLSSPSSKTYV